MRKKLLARRDHTATTRYHTPSSRQPSSSSSNENDDSPVLHMKYPQPGKCNPGICGDDAACLPFPNHTYMCLCPHDSSPPTIDLLCPNRRTVPLTPLPIHNIIPPSGGKTTTQRPNITTSAPVIETFGNIDAFTPFFIVPSILVVVIFIVIFFGCWKKKLGFCREKASRKPDPPLTGEPLLAERYISNPQYSSGCGGPNGAEERTFVPTISVETLCFMEEIGEGCFGKVFRGELKLEDSSITVAIKVLKDCDNRNAEDDFNREVSIMSSFRHENILRLIGVVQRMNGSHTPWIVFEYMPYGDLADVLRSNAPYMRKTLPGLPPLDKRGLLLIALQIANGMKYLAAKRFVHRDLACRNCLVGDNLTVKIADFGLSRDVYTCDYYKMGGKKPMPIRWMSPESIVYAKFTLESDVWSYGVVLWEIYSFGKQPFFGHDNQEARDLILQGIMLIPSQKCPSYISELMKECWHHDPKNRINFYDICEKLESVKDNEFSHEPEEYLKDDREMWSKSLSRVIIKSEMNLPKPPATLPNIPLSPSPPPLEQLMDPEGYLVPAPPAQVCEYITAIPD